MQPGSLSTCQDEQCQYIFLEFFGVLINVSVSQNSIDKVPMDHGYQSRALGCSMGNRTRLRWRNLPLDVLRSWNMPPWFLPVCMDSMFSLNICCTENCAFQGAILDLETRTVSRSTHFPDTLPVTLTRMLRTGNTC